METTQQQETVVTPPPTTTSSTGIFGTKIPATAAFLVAVLLFLLPFAEVRCNGSALANNTGLGIAIGSEWKEAVSKNIFGESLNTNNEQKEFNQKQDPNVFAIAALALGVLGLLIAFLNFKGGGKINLFIGLLAAVSLIAMLINLKSKAKSDTSIKSSDVNFNMGMKITVDGTGWFYLTLILFFTAAVFSWQRNKAKTG
jgi:hypothetical protein